jgi:phosphocarrier protein HPr
VKTSVGIEKSSISSTATLINRLGLHTRPATLIVQLLQKFNSSVYFTHLGTRINARSVLNLLTLAAKFGEKILIEIEGEDAPQVLEQLEALFNCGFDEE